jgi:hypothetical protein
MTREEICERLVQEHHAFIHYISSMNEKQFMFAPPGKWTAGQQLDHINRAVIALRQALMVPKFILRLVFPRANRPSKAYEDLVIKYQGRLQKGGRAAGRFVPSAIPLEQQQLLAGKLDKEIEKLCRLTNRYSEEQTDKFILPHPLLGKLTLREMLYFTIYHVQHHHRLTVENLMRMSDQ